MVIHTALADVNRAHEQAPCLLRWERIRLNVALSGPKKTAVPRAHSVRARGTSVSAVCQTLI